MGLSGLEPPTSRLSGVRSNRLSYKPLSRNLDWRFHSFSFFVSGSHLLSRAVSSKVPSAAPGLTIVFGMGTGVSPGRIAARHLSAVVLLFRADPISNPLRLPAPHEIYLDN